MAEGLAVTPYFTGGAVTLYHGDCREVLPGLAVEADLCLTDPPYGETSLEWDRWPDGWPSLVRAPQLWCFGSMRMFLARVADFAGWKLAQDLVWEKQQGILLRPDRFVRVHEALTHWYRGEWGDLHHDPPRAAGGTRKRFNRAAGDRHVYGERGSSAVDDGGWRYARSVIYANTPHRGTGLHPTQKPTTVLAPLITYSTPPGGLVLDPFAGSGSTLVAAQHEGRRAVGIEAREDYCDIAARRLAQGVLAL